MKHETNQQVARARAKQKEEIKNHRILLLLIPLIVLTVGTRLVSANPDDDKVTRSDALATTLDPATFGANFKFAGLIQTGQVYLASDCTPDPNNPLGPDDRCVLLAPCPAPTTFDLRDIGRIALPGNTAKNMLFTITT